MELHWIILPGQQIKLIADGLKGKRPSILGLMHYFGQGVEVNYRAAFRHFTKAANQTVNHEGTRGSMGKAGHNALCWSRDASKLSSWHWGILTRQQNKVIMNGHKGKLGQCWA